MDLLDIVLVVCLVILLSGSVPIEGFSLQNFILQAKKNMTESVINSVNSISIEKPPPEEVIELFKKVKVGNRNLDFLNELIKEAGYTDYEVPLRGFIQLIKLDLKNNLTPSSIKPFL